MTIVAERQRAEDRAAWTADDVRSDRSWLFVLSEDERTALHDAAVKTTPKPLSDMSARSFDFGDAEAALAAASIEVDKGRGFALIRGFDPLGLSPAELSKLFYGVGTRFGSMRSQNAAGELVSEIKDRGFAFSDPASRGYTTRDELNPHSDGCDILALLCVRPAKAGGENTVVSSLALHNAILEREPELLEPLYRGFYNDLRGESLADGQTGVSATRWPVFLRHEGVLSCGFNPKSIRNAPLKLGQPLSPSEERALDMVERLAKSAEFALELVLQPGDMLFLNNLTSLHSRTVFEDHDEVERKRLLLRLWISSARPRPLPDEIAKIVRGGFTARPPG